MVHSRGHASSQDRCHLIHFGFVICYGFGLLRGEKLLTFTQMEERPELLMRAWPLPDGEPKVLGTFDIGHEGDIDPGGTTLAYPRGRTSGSVARACSGSLAAG